MSWGVVCRGRKEGGLGILNLESQNFALFAKWWWRYLSPSSHLWGPIIEGIYYNRRRPLREGASFKSFSQWWRSVLGTKDAFKCGICYTIGDGNKTCFWSDIWIG